MSADNPFVAMIARYSSDENSPVLFVREILGATPEGCRVVASGCPNAVITRF